MKIDDDHYIGLVPVDVEGIVECVTYTVTAKSDTKAPEGAEEIRDLRPGD